MAITKFQPPPTYAMPVIEDARTRQSVFNPIWLKWFLDLSQNLGSGGAGSGSVSSVGLNLPSQFLVSGSPVTGAGTLSASWNTQLANKVFAGPATGVAAVPTFRGLVAADIPALSYAPLTAGTAILYGNGTGGFSSVTIGSGVSFTGGTLSATGTGGTITSVTATAPLASSGGTTPDISFTGVLAIANGGTNGTAAPTAGAIAYGTGTAYSFSLAGTSGYFLKSGGTGVPTWSNNIGGYIVDGTAPYLDWADGSAVVLAAGRMWYDGVKGSMVFGMGNGAISQQVGEEFFQYGKASAAISDVNLQLVYKTGVVGASGVITFAPTVAGITDTDLIIGIATEPLALNAFGRVTTLGTVNGINTTGSVYGETWANNDDIWYNPVTGGLTKIKPAAPNVKQQVGTIINAGPGGSGSFYVKIAGSSILGGTDANVQLGTLVSGDSLVYDSALGYWLNKQASALSGVPITKTANFSVAPGETWFINNKSGSTCTVTLPAAASFIGRSLTFHNYQAFTLSSAASNVVPQGGGAASTGILLGVVGNWATLVSDGTNWVIMQAAAFNNLLLE